MRAFGKVEAKIAEEPLRVGAYKLRQYIEGLVEKKVAVGHSAKVRAAAATARLLPDSLQEQLMVAMRNDGRAG
ncbi:hypothetical protein GCM10028786_18710 [Flaviaesturariibacter terrae]